MDIRIRSYFLLNVAPYFSQDIIHSYCKSIDEKEEKGLCTNDLKRDLLRLIQYTVGQTATEKQKQAIAYIDECIQSYDGKLEKLWRQLEGIPLLKQDAEAIGEDFYIWKAGTSKYDIWNWFDFHHSKGVYHLLYLQN